MDGLVPTFPDAFKDKGNLRENCPVDRPESPAQSDSVWGMAWEQAFPSAQGGYGSEPGKSMQGTTRLTCFSQLLSDLQTDLPHTGSIPTAWEVTLWVRILFVGQSQVQG